MMEYFPVFFSSILTQLLPPIRLPSSLLRSVFVAKFPNQSSQQVFPLLSGVIYLCRENIAGVHRVHVTLRSVEGRINWRDRNMVLRGNLSQVLIGS